jgi:hypothetical protein
MSSVDGANTLDRENTKPPLEIRVENTYALLARVESLDELDAWWKANEASWFGLRVNGHVIEVAAKASPGT